MPILSACQLDVSIAGKQVCRGLDFALEEGQLCGILGINGIGKTTLLLTLSGLRSPDSGEILLDGRPLRTLPRTAVAQRLGVLFQQDTDSFPATVLETVLIGRHPHLRPWRFESPGDVDIARRSLSAVGLTGMEQRLLTTLSGGERRRLAVATLLCQEPQVLLLDEPTTHLDLHHQLRLLGLFRARVDRSHIACVVVLHDVNLAIRYCDRVLLLFGDGLTEQGLAHDVLTAATLGRLYRHPLMQLPTPYGDIFVPQ